MQPDIFHPERAAHATIRGYLYQACLGVQRWLELSPDEVLLCEGDEDLDRLILGGGGISEQVKAYSGGLGASDEAVRESLRNFLLSYVSLHQRGEDRRFRFTTTAYARRPRIPGAEPDLLRAWQEGERGPEVVAAVRNLLLAAPRGRKAASRRHTDEIARGLEWLEREPERWTGFLDAVEWCFDAPDLPQVRHVIRTRLSSRAVARHLPAEVLVDRLIVEVLETSSRKEPARRLLSSDGLSRFLEEARTELATWASSPEAFQVRAVFEELTQIGRLLYDHVEELPSLMPGKLLTAAYEVLPFDKAGRRAELDLLAGWCGGKESRSVLLLTGSGGSGKTRLMVEWCRHLRSQGWHAGFLRRDRGAEALDPLLEGVNPRLVVVDYAETRLRVVETLLLKSGLADRGGGPKLRIVLLARRVGDWWEGLSRQESAIEDLILRSPGPVQITPLHLGLKERSRAYHKAQEVFAAHLGLTPSGSLVPDLGREGFERPLDLQMAALAALLGESVTTAQDALVQTLDHERRFWRSEVRELGLDESLASALAQALEQAVTAVTLAGGTLNGEESRALLGWIVEPFALRADLLTTLLRVLRRLYGGSGAEEPRDLEPLQPDALGEQLVFECLDRNAVLLDRFLEAAGCKAATSCLTVLTRLAQRSTGAEDWLRAALRGHLGTLGESALEIAVETGEPMGFLLAREVERFGDLEAVMQLNEVLSGERFQNSLPLADVALAATVRELELLQAQEDPRGEERQALLATLFHNQGRLLSTLGRNEEALLAERQAVVIRRDLADKRPEIHRYALLRSLSNLSVTLRNLGRLEESFQAAGEAVRLSQELFDSGGFFSDALQASNNLGVVLMDLGLPREAVQIFQEIVHRYRLLAGEQPETFHPHLAVALQNLGKTLGECGQHEEALESNQESLRLHRRLVEQRPDVFLPGLARCLTNEGALLWALGRREEACQATGEALQLYRRLSQRRPESFLHDLAWGFSNLSAILNDLKRPREAAEVSSEGIELLREPAVRQPAAFMEALAMSFLNRGNARRQLGEWAEAADDTRVATEIFRKLAAVRPESHRAKLVKGLSNLAILLPKVGRMAEALEASREAVEAARQLADHHPEAFLPDLARSLLGLGNRLLEIGQIQPALAPFHESVELYNKLAVQWPDVYQPELSMSLNNLGAALSEMGQAEAALSFIREAIRIRRQLALRYPGVFQFDLAMSLTNLTRASLRVPYEEEALDAARESVELLRKAVQELPEIHLPRLAAALGLLALTLSRAEETAQAVEVNREAAGLYRQLGEGQPEVFLPELAFSLHNLANRLTELGRRTEAFHASEEAVRIFRPFFLREPQRLGPRMELLTTSYQSCSRTAGREPDESLIQ